MIKTNLGRRSSHSKGEAPEHDVTEYGESRESEKAQWSKARENVEGDEAEEGR